MTKTLSFAAVHFSVAFSLTWALTGDPFIGGLVALIEPMVNTVAYFFHERIWQRMAQNRQASPVMSPAIRIDRQTDKSVLLI